MCDHEKSIAHAIAVSDDDEIAAKWEERRGMEEAVTELRRKMAAIDAWIDERAKQLKEEMK